MAACHIYRILVLVAALLQLNLVGKAQGYDAGKLDDMLRPDYAPVAPEQVGRSAASPPVAPLFKRTALPGDSMLGLNGLNRLSNFHVVTPFLLRGGQPTAEDLLRLRSAGVKTVVDLRNETVLVRQEAVQARLAGLSFINIPLDVFNSPSRQAVSEFLKVVEDAARQPIYVHCLHGQDRTGTMIAIYRIERQGWNADQAYSEMLSCGFRPGFSQLSRAVFDYGARAGRPGRAPTGGDIVLDLERRMSHKK